MCDENKCWRVEALCDRVKKIESRLVRLDKYADEYKATVGKMLDAEERRIKSVRDYNDLIEDYNQSLSQNEKLAAENETLRNRIMRLEQDNRSIREIVS